MKRRPRGLVSKMRYTLSKYGKTFCPKDGTTLINQSAASNDPLINLVLDERYHIDSLIGTGAMGRVYKATQINVGRDVAVKVLNAVASQNAEVVTRFQSEARIISELRHPNTLKLLDFGHTPEGQLFIVLELLKGCSLEDELAKGAMSGDQGHVDIKASPLSARGGT